MMNSDTEQGLGFSFTRTPLGSGWAWQWMHRTLSSHNVLDTVQAPASPNATLKEKTRPCSAVYWLTCNMILMILQEVVRILHDLQNSSMINCVKIYMWNKKKMVEKSE